MVDTQKLSRMPDNPQGSSLQPGVVLQNRWRIVGVLGVGGMASVYKARDLRFPDVVRHVAVKEMLNLATDPQIRELTLRNFEREANILASLSHPAMPEIYDYFPGSNHVYLVMEFINGKDLEAILNSVPMEKIPPSTILQWAIELCDVIAYLHEHEPEPIIFRDVKPSNVMIDQHGNVRLIDFGIAKVFESGQKGTMIGTEGYSAPEQYKGEATPASDIYAIGATLHHIITRRDPRLEPPFSFAERPIRKYNAQISPEFERIIMKSLAYDATERFATAREMKEALEALVHPGRIEVSSGAIGASEDGFVAGEGSSITPIWRFRCEDEIRSSPAVYNGTVYVGAYDNNLYALQATDGAFRWKFATEGGLAASPVVDPQNQVVIIGSEDSIVYAIEMRTGRIVWTIKTDRPVRCTARVAHGHVFFGSDDGKLYAAKGNGRVLWRFDASAPIRSRPYVTDEYIIFGSEAGEVVGLDLSGAPKWRFRAKRGVTSSPAVYEGVAYFGSSDWHIYAVDIRTGYSIWRFRTQKPVWSSPTVDPVTKTVFVGSVDGNLYALDIESGKERWRFTTENQITSSPAIANGSVYIGSVDRHVYSVNAKTGKLNWSFCTEGPVASSPEVVDNVVYIGSSDHYVYALPA
ncbi:MAG: serine/threonine-protein kinase [Anaerolineae bacterium]|nr:serine/threonine-protein kinase [Anaerolineae bacterium]